MADYKVWDDGLPESKAITIKAWREMQHPEYDFRILPSEFHKDGSWQVEGKKREGT